MTLIVLPLPRPADAIPIEQRPSGWFTNKWLLNYIHWYKKKKKKISCVCVCVCKWCLQRNTRFILLLWYVLFFFFKQQNCCTREREQQLGEEAWSGGRRLCVAQAPFWPGCCMKDGTWGRREGSCRLSTPLSPVRSRCRRPRMDWDCRECFCCCCPRWSRRASPGTSTQGPGPGG